MDRKPRLIPEEQALGKDVTGRKEGKSPQKRNKLSRWRLLKRWWRNGGSRNVQERMEPTHPCKTGRPSWGYHGDGHHQPGGSFTPRDTRRVGGPAGGHRRTRHAVFASM